MRIANGRLGSDHLIGTYTYTCHAGSSIIVYLILSQHDFSHIADFEIGSFCEWSDHAPMSFNILCNRVPDTVENTQYTHTLIKWDDSLRDEFRRGLIGRLPDFNSAVNILDTSDKSSVNSCVESFTQILNNVARPLFSSSKTYKKSPSNCYNNRLCNKS